MTVHIDNLSRQVGASGRAGRRLLAPWVAAGLLALVASLLCPQSMRAADEADPVAAVDTLFGREIARVKATSDPKDNIELAKQLLSAASNASIANNVAAVLCLRIDEIVRDAEGGEDVSISALQLGMRRDPARKVEFLDHLVSAYQRKLLVADREQRDAIAESLVVTMIAHADLVAETDADKAMPLYTRALTMSTRVRSDLRDQIIQKRIAARDRAAMQQQVIALRGKLEADPTNTAVHAELLRIYLVEFDDPRGAATYAELGGDADAKRYLPLASKPVAEVPTVELLGLADYFRMQAAKATHMKPALLRRAIAYNEALLTREAADALSRTKAELSLKSLGEELRQLVGDDKTAAAGTGQGAPPVEPVGPRQVPDAVIQWSRTVLAKPADEQLQTIVPKLRELNAGREFIVSGQRVVDGKLANLDLSGNAGLETIDPLYGQQLTEVSVARCADLKDLAALRGMKITRLNLAGCAALKNLDDLRGMPLESLDLRGCAGLTCDLSVLKGMPLRELYVDGCKGIKGDLSALRGSPIENLSLVGCASLTSLEGIQDMAKLSLRRGLDLTNCKSLSPDLAPLSGRPIGYLTIDGCVGLTSLKGLETAPLQQLSAKGCSSLVVNIAMIRAAKLELLNIDGTKGVLNLGVLTTMPVRDLSIVTQQKPTPTELQPLGKIATLRRVSTGNPTTDAKIISQARRKN